MLLAVVLTPRRHLKEHQLLSLQHRHKPIASPQPRIVVDDEDDADYAPKVSHKKKERAAKPRAVKRSSAAPPNKGPKTQPPEPGSFDPKKTWSIIEEARARAILSGKPELGEAVRELYAQSLQNGELMVLLQAILAQKASAAQTARFQHHVKLAKKKLKEQADKAKKRVGPELSNGTQSLPVRSPSKLTPRELETSSAIPSTESAQPSKAKTISLKATQPGRDSTRRRSGQSATMSASPLKARSGSPAGSDSSLTDLTSNPDDDMDLDESGGPSTAAGPSTLQAKDHAAERGSLAAPNRALKRSSADAEFLDDERERELAAKKQKLNEGITREESFEESNVRESGDSRASRLRLREGKGTALRPPSLSLETGGAFQSGGRGSRGVSTDLDSPLSTPLTASSRQSTPHIYKGPAKTIGKKAKTKQS